MTHSALAFFQNIGALEFGIIALFALLLFGRRLPEVARSLGKSIIEFKRGMKDVRDDVEQPSRIEPPSKSEPPKLPDNANHRSPGTPTTGA